MLTVVAGRVDGTAERPQLLPLEQLAIELYRGDQHLGRLALVRDLLPGALLVRDHRARAGWQAPAAGRILAPPHRDPIDGGGTDEQIVPFTIRSDRGRSGQCAAAEYRTAAAV